MEEHKKFLERVKKTSGCWIWIGAKTEKGYGQFIFNQGKGFRAHRYAVEYYHKTKIPEDMTVDHLCNNPSCVNPKHLAIVTMRDNVLRSGGVTAKNFRKTHCKRGHELTPENIYCPPNKKFPQRNCRKCKAMWSKQWEATHIRIYKKKPLPTQPPDSPKRNEEYDHPSQ